MPEEVLKNVIKHMVCIIQLKSLQFVVRFIIHNIHHSYKIYIIVS